MTVNAMSLTGAPSAIELTWDAINWQKVGATYVSYRCVSQRLIVRKMSWVANKQLYKGLSRMQGNLHVRFLWDWVTVTSPGYQTLDPI